MSVNTFFFVLLSGLLGIYLYFTPMDIKEKEDKEVAMLDLVDFSVYKFDPEGLQSIMKGSTGKRFEDRYEVDDVDYTDDNKVFIQHMVADHALHKGEDVFLDGNVRYRRSDEKMFLSDEAQYYHETAILTTRGPFTIVDKSDWLIGKKLYYDSVNKVAKGDQIKGVYTLLQTKEER